MPLTELSEGILITTTSSSIKAAYSCYFEVQLDEIHFGMSREDHNIICNRQLLIQLQALESERVQLHPDVSNNYLIEQITQFKNKPPGTNLFVWEHCSSVTANGRLGVMRLVPSEQHIKIKSNEFWKAIHPDYRDRGGYYEWAIPAGAPANRSKTIRPVPPHINIQTLNAEVLPVYFKAAVSANRYDQFEQLLKRANEICSESQHKAIFAPHQDTGQNLLHLAVQNGNLL